MTEFTKLPERLNKEKLVMKDNYELLKMEVIVFDADAVDTAAAQTSGVVEQGSDSPYGS